MRHAKDIKEMISAHEIIGLSSHNELSSSSDSDILLDNLLYKANLVDTDSKPRYPMTMHKKVSKSIAEVIKS